MMQNTKKFFEYMNNNVKFKNYYKNIGSPKAFDVTLRDGLQSIKKEDEIKKYNLEYKKQLYNDICTNYKPLNIEVGSIVSSKIMPILADSIELFEYAERKSIKKSSNYILIPNMLKLGYVLNKPFFNNFSFITSVSNSFQKRNTNMDLKTTRNEFTNILYLLDDSQKIDYNLKVYISCINECPIEGKLDNDYVIHEILKYNDYCINNICLSDTCGTLEVEDFEYIVDTCYHFGIPYSKFSLHLHVNRDRIDTVKQILFKAFDRKFRLFDVSLLDSGGCSVTMEEKNLLPNLSYELFYGSIIEYIERKIRNES